jgi:arylsulfatase A-like enzyme
MRSSNCSGKRGWRRSVVAVLAAIGLAVHAFAAARPPNFVFILTDDQTYRAIGYNNAQVRTPSLDALAKSGVIFEHAYVASPICVASRASLLTGLYPQQNGAIGLSSSAFTQRVVRERALRTFPQLLATANYRTAFFGKSHLGDPKAYGFHEGAEQRLDAEAFASASEFFARAAKRPEPFFVWLAPHAPHVPLLPGQAWLDLYAAKDLSLDPNFRESPSSSSLFDQGIPGQPMHRDSTHTSSHKSLPAGPPRAPDIMREFIRAYYASISELDDRVGRLVATLKQHRLDDNTVIIFLSDNGYFLGNHGLGNKITMHEEAVRVPMFVHGPAVKAPGARSRALVSSLDVYPTVLELAGVALPPGLPGRSLGPLLAQPAAPHREFVISECVGVGGKLGEGHRMVRTAGWKYILSVAGEEALYNEISDPYELTNLAGDSTQAAVRLQLRSHLVEWMEAVGDSHPRPR